MERHLPFLVELCPMKRLDPIIVTPRLALRPPTEADLDDITGAVGDPGVAKMLARVPSPYRRSDAENFLRSAALAAAAGASLNLSIEHAGRVIGGVGIADIRRRAEFGYWLGRTYWGRGFATEAGRAILVYGFDVLRLRLIRSGVFVDNRASMRVQAKLGFRPIGRSRRMSLARGVAVAHIDTVLTRARFEALPQ